MYARLGGDDRRKRELRQFFIIGWVNYFKLADMMGRLRNIDAWYWRRQRMVILKQWKRVGTRMRNLIRLEVKKSKAWPLANTRKFYWHLFRSDRNQKARLKT